MLKLMKKKLPKKQSNESINQELKEETLILMQDMLFMMKGMNNRIDELEKEVKLLRSQVQNPRNESKIYQPNLNYSMNNTQKLYDLRN